MPDAFSPPPDAGPAATARGTAAASAASADAADAVVGARERQLQAQIARLSERVRQLERRVYEAEHELGAVLDVVPIGIGISRDPECRDIRVNPAFAAQLGIRPGDNASKSGPDGDALPFRVLHEGREVPADELAMQRAARERRTLTDLEYDIVHADGRVVRLLEYAAPLLDAAGASRGAVGVFLDITERTRLVEAERAARDEAERANRVKSEFLAIMSHELRTPLNAIGGYAQLLAMGVRGPVTAEQQEDLERIQRSQRHLLGLISEVLNYAKLETNTVQFDLVAVDLVGALASVEALVLPQVAARGLALEIADCPPDRRLRADAEKLRQILLNLLSNAVKFTPPGARITVTSAERADGTVAIAVRDTGVGIAPDQQERIFEPFVQIGRTLSNPGEGAGLGLAISRDLARAMAGELTVESAPGVGSTFTLVLPRA